VSAAPEEEAEGFNLVVRLVMSIWAGTVWGWPWGVGAFIAFIIVMAVTKLFLIANDSGPWGFLINRWIWVVALGVVIVASSASYETL